MGSLILAIFFILFADAVVSAAEAAIYTVPKHRARLLAEKSRFGKVLLSLKESMELPITTLNVLSNLIIIVGSVFTGLIANRTFGEAWVGVFAAVLTILVMIIGEIVPKRLGERYAEVVAVASAPAVLVISRVLTPVIWLIRGMTVPLISGAQKTTSKEEIAFLASVAEKEGSLEMEENQLIQRVIGFNEITAADIMTPRPFVNFIDGDKTIGELSEIIQNLKNSRLPVFERDENNIVGIVHQRSLLIAIAKGELGEKIRKYAWEAMIVPESRLIDDLLRDMREKKAQLAVVVSEYGNLVGVIGIEDILEELVGEIIDEKDIAPEFIKRVSRTEIIAHGQSRISYVNHFFNTEIKSKKTLNGFLMEKFGKVPAVGEIYGYKDIKFIIEASNQREIEKVRVVKEPLK